MIIEIIKGVITFSLILGTFIVAIMLSFMAIREGDDAADFWQISYRLAYGDFEEEYPNWQERLFFFIGTFLMNLVLMNLIIAIMGDYYD